jgi:hypothetical protein
LTSAWAPAESPWKGSFAQNERRGKFKNDLTFRDETRLFALEKSTANASAVKKLNSNESSQRVF